MNWNYRITKTLPSESAAKLVATELSNEGPMPGKFSVRPDGRAWRICAVVYGKAVWDGVVDRLVGPDYGRETRLG